MTEENKNLVGEIVSIEKVGEKVLITKEKISDELRYADPNSEDPKKPDYILTGDEAYTPVQTFATKEIALDHYGVQLKNCKYGISVIQKGIDKISDEELDSKIFAQIDKIAGKMDNAKYNGKYKALDFYMEKYGMIKRGNNEIKMRSKHVPYFETIIKHIEEL